MKISRIREYNQSSLYHFKDNGDNNLLLSKTGLQYNLDYLLILTKLDLIIKSVLKQ